MINKVADHSLRDLYRYLRKRVLRQKLLTEFSDQYPCVFTLSTGRVGTQTLTALFSLTPTVLAYHEPSPILYGLSKLSYLYGGDSEMPAHRILKEAFSIARNKRLEFALSCHKGYIETSPQGTFLAPIILESISNVRFIHLVRDPRYVVTSGMRRNWYSGHAADKTRIVPRENSEMALHWQSLPPFQKNLWLWTETNEWILYFLSSLPEDRQLIIHAEDIFRADEVALEKLFAFIGSRRPPMTKIARVLRRKYNAQKTGIYVEPSAWSEDMLGELERIAGATMRKLGYEL